MQEVFEFKPCSHWSGYCLNSVSCSKATLVEKKMALGAGSVFE
jgi:hypothetical protein